MDWNEFNGATITEANAQGVKLVFDHNCLPLTIEAKELFHEKQKFVLSVFERALQTQNGKSIVRKHRDDGDAQKVWKEVCDVYEQSIHASVNAADLLEYITTARLGDGKWKSGCENFIIHWDKTCDDYDNLCEDPSDCIVQGQRKTLLQNAVSRIDDLCAGKVTQDQLKSAGGSATQLYDQYLAFVKSAAIGYDKAHGKFTKAKARTTVYTQNSKITTRVMILTHRYHIYLESLRQT